MIKSSIISDNHSNSNHIDIDTDFGQFVADSRTDAAALSQGGGIFNSSDATLHMSNSIVSGNSVDADADASSSALSTAVSFSEAISKAEGYGAGLYNRGTMSIINSVVSGNYTKADANSMATSGTFGTNTFERAVTRATTLAFGSGIFNDSNSNLNLTNCTISGNKNLANSSATPMAQDSTLAETTTLEVGGGLSNQGFLVITNTIYALNNSLTNPDIDSPGQITDGGNNLIGNASGHEARLPNTVLKGNSITPINPMFISDVPQTTPSTLGDLRLMSLSPAINAGRRDTAGLLLGAVDVDSMTRIQDCIIDIGAYESMSLDTAVCLENSSLSGASTSSLGESAALMATLLNSDVWYYLTDDDGTEHASFISSGNDSTINTLALENQSSFQLLGHSTSDSSLYFDGSGATLSIPPSSPLRPTDAMTISAWIYAEDLVSTPFQVVYRKEDGNDRHLFSFQIGGDTLAFGLQTTNNTYQELNVGIDKDDFENQWVHVVATYDGAFQRIYINGEISDSLSMTGSMSTVNSAAAYIGSSGGSFEFFKGRMDDVTMWSRALSSSELQSVMKTCEMDCSDLIFSFEMSSTSSGSIKSRFGRPHEASIVNMNSPHARPDTLLRRGAARPLSNTHIVEIINRKIYVDSSATDGSNNGTSWANAFIHIDSALMHLNAGDTLFVAKGVYECDHTIQINKPMALIGSHPNGGGNTDINTHPTELLVDDDQALLIDISSGSVTLKSLILATTSTGIAEVEIESGEVELSELQIN